MRKPKKRYSAERGKYALPMLADLANKFVHKTSRIELKWFEYIKKCGHYLNRAKGLLKHGAFGRWLEENFEASHETANDYMWIDSVWLEPRFKKARESGKPIGGIAGVKALLGGKKLAEEKAKPLSTEKQKIDMRREYIRKMFAKKLREELSKDDLYVLAEEFIFDDLWNKWYPIIRDTVCEALEYDPYEYENDNKFYKRWVQSERAEKEIRQKTAKAINRNRKTA